MPQHKGAIPWNKGIKLTKEHCLKLGLSHKGKKHSEEWKKNQSMAMRGIKKPPRTEEHRRNLSEAKKKEYRNGRESPFKKIWAENPDYLRGSNNYKWLIDRSKIKISDRILNDPLRKEWTRSVKNRDKWECKIKNKDCNGRMEAHHILPWRSHPELRYNINNGITLCHAHHPKRRAEEKLLAPIFQRLVGVLTSN